MRPIPQSDCHYAPWLIDKFVPGMAAVVDDIFVGLEDPIGQPVVAHELPDILHHVKLRALRWQRQQGNVGWHGEVA